MNSFPVDVCSRTKDLINLIDATMVEVVLYARGDTLIYADESAFQRQLLVQAEAIGVSITELDGIIRQHHEFFESTTPPENVPGQVLAIAEVIVDKLQRYSPTDGDRADQLYRSMPLVSRHELMERLRAYRDYIFRAAGLERAEPGDPGFTTEPLNPYWW